MMDQDIVYFFDQHMDSLALYEAFESKETAAFSDKK